MQEMKQTYATARSGTDRVLAAPARCRYAARAHCVRCVAFRGVVWFYGAAAPSRGRCRHRARTGRDVVIEYE